ncbi:MAG TPA: BON domain-containing protein [Verrucomicrobiae bacterium]|nr:BON domain-containing protein [Verrucomicrobiae bacterium]
MKWLRLIPLVFLVGSGCVRSHRAEPVVYYVPEPAPLTPTSERASPRVYAPLPAPNVSAGDVATAESIRHLLNDNPHLAAVSGGVLVTVRSGLVTLRGTTPTEHDHDEIVERISRLPGVVQIDDHLGLSDER